jgi:hypothetical protein
LAQSLGLFFYSLLKRLKRFILLLPDSAVWVAEDLRTGLDVSASVFLLLFDSFGDGMEVHLTE